MKKRYTQPQMIIREVRMTPILAGSPTVGNGTTGQQNAKGVDCFDGQNAPQDMLLINVLFGH